MLYEVITIAVIGVGQGGDDADDLPLPVKERSTGIARVDGCVKLDETLQTAAAFVYRHRPVKAGNDASAPCANVRPSLVRIARTASSFRITSYNVCYTKLLREHIPMKAVGHLVQQFLLRLIRRILEALQFQDMTRQMLESAVDMLDAAGRRLSERAAASSSPVSQRKLNERFDRVRKALIARAKTNAEKDALMEVRL